MKLPNVFKKGPHTSGADIKFSQTQPPIDSPNYILKKEVEARETALDAGLVADPYDEGGFNYQLGELKYKYNSNYVFALQIGAQWMGQFKHNITDIRLLQLIPIFLQHLFLYGSIGLVYDPIGKGKYSLVNLMDTIKYNNYGQIDDDVEVSCYDIATTIYTDGYGTKDFKPTTGIMVKGKDLVIFRYNPLGWGYWVLYNNEFDNYRQNRMLFNQAVPTLTKKLQFNTNKPHSIKVLMKNMFNGSPFLIKTVNDGTNYGADNTINPTKIVNGSENVNLTSIIEANEHQLQNIMYLIGLRANINDKTERNINSEVQYSQSRFDACENAWLNCLNPSWELASEKFKNLGKIKFTILSIDNEASNDNQEVDKDEDVDNEQNNK